MYPFSVVLLLLGMLFLGKAATALNHQEYCKSIISLLTFGNITTAELTESACLLEDGQSGEHRSDFAPAALGTISA